MRIAYRHNKSSLPGNNQILKYPFREILSNDLFSTGSDPRPSCSRIHRVRVPLLGAFWIPVALAFPGPREGTLPVILVFSGTFGPAVSALILSRVVAGKKGVASLGRRVIQWRVGKHWYAAAVCLPPVVILTALILFIASGHPAGSVSALVPWYLLPLAFVFSMITGGPLAEEPGWRGFALPTMLESFSPLAASISLGSIWSLWAPASFLYHLVVPERAEPRLLPYHEYRPDDPHDMGIPAYRRKYPDCDDIPHLIQWCSNPPAGQPGCNGQ